MQKCEMVKMDYQQNHNKNKHKNKNKNEEQTHHPSRFHTKPLIKMSAAAPLCLKVNIGLAVVLACVAYIAPLWSSYITNNEVSGRKQAISIGAFISIDAEDFAGETTTEISYTEALLGASAGGSVSNEADNGDINAIHIVFQIVSGLAFLSTIALSVMLCKGNAGKVKLTAVIVAVLSLLTWVFSLVEYYTSDAKDVLDGLCEQVSKCKNIPQELSDGPCCSGYFGAGYYLLVPFTVGDMFVLPFSASFVCAVLLNVLCVVVAVQSNGWADRKKQQQTAVAAAY